MASKLQECNKMRYDDEMRLSTEDEEGFEIRSKSKRNNQIYKLPDKPMPEDTILNRIKGGSEKSRKFYTNGGKMSASVFWVKDDHWDFIGLVMRETIESNLLWATEFSSITL